MRKSILLLGLSVIATPAFAQSGGDTITVADSLRDNLITVVATGTRQRIDWAGQPVTIVTRAEIETVQGPDLTRVLERLPGVTLTRNAGLGSFTGVRVRGADAEQLLVLVDGVRVADVSAPGGGFDFGNLTSGEVQRIDLLRGSNSVIWGSQAIGGVLAVMTRDLDGVSAGAEYGAHDTFSTDVAAGGRLGALSGTLSGGFIRSDGISAAAVGIEPDGYRQWRVGGKARVDLGQFALVANARWLDSRLDIDGFPAPTYAFADTPEFQKTREASGRVGAEWNGAGVQLRGGYALSDTRRSYYDPSFGSAPNYQTFGRSQRADLVGHAGTRVTVDFGADSEWTGFRSTFDAQHSARLASAHALLGWHPDRLNLAAGLRYDDHSRFGGQWTFGANGSFELGGAWRLRGSYGEGFKTPTLFQLFSDFGNQALDPERSRSFDVGVERGDRNGALHFAATAFRRDSRDLIDFVSCFGVTGGICPNRPFGTYDNVRRARAEGFELEADARVSDRLHGQIAYSYVHASNRDTARDLARRPRHALSAALDWITPLAGLKLGADARLVSDSFDDAGGFTRLDGYPLLTLRASLPLGDRFEVYGRVENVTDQDYQQAAGYGTYGRSAYAGVRARF